MNEGFQRNAKTQVRNPGGHGKGTSMLFFPTSSLEQFGINDFLNIFLVIPAT